MTALTSRAGTLAGGRYRIGSLISQSPAAQVFRGYDHLLDRPVAITVFAPGASEGEQFRRARGGRLLAGLHHHALPAVFDAGPDDHDDHDDHDLDEHDQGPEHAPGFVVTQLVEGPTLAARLGADGAMTVPVTAGLGAALADALACVHHHGLVHRGVSPAAVILAEPDARPYLGEFTLAAASEATAITTDRSLAGPDPTNTATGKTGCYLAPEQVTGRSVGSPADIYALGLLLLECLTGRPEYPGDPVVAATWRLHHPPEIPTGLPVRLATLLEAMTATTPTDRPPAAHAARELRALTSTPAQRTASAPPADPDLAGSADPVTPDPTNPDPAPAAGPDRPRAGAEDAAHQPRRRGRWRWAAAFTGAGLVLGLAAGVAYAGAVPSISTRAQGTPSSTSSAVSAAVAAGLEGPPTLFGRVTEVPDPATVVVDVAGRPIPVQVLGIDPSATPACAAGDAVAFARRTLLGQSVTLVPDPTLAPPADAPGPLPPYRAYVVLISQQSYTDAATAAGWTAPGNSAGLYRPVFDREQRDAQTAAAGMWGPPCQPPPAPLGG